MIDKILNPKILAIPFLVSAILFADTSQVSSNISAKSVFLGRKYFYQQKQLLFNWDFAEVMKGNADASLKLGVSTSFGVLEVTSFVTGLGFLSAAIISQVDFYNTPVVNRPQVPLYPSLYSVSLFCLVGNFIVHIFTSLFLEEAIKSHNRSIEVAKDGFQPRVIFAGNYIDLVWKL